MDAERNGKPSLRFIFFAVNRFDRSLNYRQGGKHTRAQVLYGSPLGGWEGVLSGTGADVGGVTCWEEEFLLHS